MQTLPNTQNSKKPSFLYRLHLALGPVLGGLILDFIDLTTFGPLGIGGLFLGGLVGWWISTIHNFSKKSRLFWTALSGIYCLIPSTEFLPLATIISAVSRFNKSKK